jgi:HD-like signal output (HDOD) protein
MRRLLFVDDETLVLDGLRDLLRSRRREWHMVFADGAAAALRELAAQPFDVVITDMRMPQMDGAELLTRVQQEWPATVRIILSGHTEQAAAARAIGVAHQFLAKPCDASQLSATIERTLAVRELLSSESLRESMGRIKALPARPEIHAKLVKCVRDENSSCADVADLLEQDIALAARVLHMANSGFFGMPRRITGLTEAVEFMGLRTVENLSLALAVFAPGPAMRTRVDVAALQRHALSVGTLARKLVSDPKLQDEAFVAGMLHDIGTLVIATHLPERFAETVAGLVASPRPMHEFETERWGVSHAEMGAYLLGLWNLPYPVVETVALHHRLDRNESASELVTAVHVADVLAHEITRAPCPVEHDSPPTFDMAYLELAGVSDRLEDWRDVARALDDHLSEAA